jgi:hypothetical protein
MRDHVDGNNGTDYVGHLPSRQAAGDGHRSRPAKARPSGETFCALHDVVDPDVRSQLFELIRPVDEPTKGTEFLQDLTTDTEPLLMASSRQASAPMSVSRTSVERRWHELTTGRLGQPPTAR